MIIGRSKALFQEKSSDERSDVGSQAAESDYDVDEEYDNDYAENYFDNGEGDDMDDLGAGGDDGGGGTFSFVFLCGLITEYLLSVFRWRLRLTLRCIVI